MRGGIVQNGQWRGGGKAEIWGCGFVVRVACAGAGGAVARRQSSQLAVERSSRSLHRDKDSQQPIHRGC
jgi:hypothetical protein